MRSAIRVLRLGSAGACVSSGLWLCSRRIVQDIGCQAHQRSVCRLGPVQTTLLSM